MKLVYTLIIALMCAATAHAAPGQTDRVFNGDVLGATGATVVSRTFPVANADRIGVWFQVNRGASNGLIAVDMDMQASYDDTSANFATVQTVSSPTANTVGATVNSVSAPPLKYVRFIAKGKTTNATDNTVTAYVFVKDYN